LSCTTDRVDCQVSNIPDDCWQDSYCPFEDDYGGGSSISGPVTSDVITFLNNTYVSDGFGTYFGSILSSTGTPLEPTGGKHIQCSTKNLVLTNSTRKKLMVFWVLPILVYQLGKDRACTPLLLANTTCTMPSLCVSTQIQFSNLVLTIGQTKLHDLRFSGPALAAHLGGKCSSSCLVRFTFLLFTFSCVVLPGL
jgi:hypothetical protein